MLSNYLFGNTDLDTEEFRNLMKTVNENIFESEAFGDKVSSAMQKAMSTGDYSDVSLALAYQSYDNEFLSDAGARATELSMMTYNPVPARLVLKWCPVLQNQLYGDMA